MFHGKISPEIAQGLKVLRQRIDAAGIQHSTLDKTLNIATWNIREFGKRRRKEASVHYIAEILYPFDLIAVVEVRDNLTDLERVMKILGPYWRVVFSDFNSDAAGNRERIAYLYDKRVVAFTGLAAEANPPRKKNRVTKEYEPTITWWRSPFLASFSSGNFDFILLTAHIRWGASEEARIPPLRHLAEWIDKRCQEKYVLDKDFIIMGDFNIPKVDDELYRAITSKGLEIPDSLRGEEHGSNLARNKRYDQILHYRRYTKTMKDLGGVLDFHCNDWRALFPESEYPEMNDRDFTFELSDHLPMWVQLDTWIEDEQLDQFLPRD